MKLNIQQKLHSIQIVNLLISLYAIYYLITTGEYWLLGVSYLIVFIYTCVGVQAGYHRLLTHRSFKTHIFFEYLMSVVGMLSIVGSPIAWVSAHRQHHRYPDTNKDPHSPHTFGVMRNLLGYWNNVKIDPGCGAYDLMRNKFQCFLHDYYFTIIFVYALVLYLINPLVGLFVFSLPGTIFIIGANAVGTFTHLGGYRRYETKDKSHNSWLGWFFSLGTEGWHNNHHAHPRNWNNQEAWWEIDFTAMWIRLIKKKD